MIPRSMIAVTGIAEKSNYHTNTIFLSCFQSKKGERRTAEVVKRVIIRIEMARYDL